MGKKKTDAPTSKLTSKFDEESRKQLGERIRLVWRESRLTQGEFSSLLEITSVTLSNYMKGERVPDALFINRLSTKLNICFEWLLAGRGPMKSGEVDNPKQDIVQPQLADEPPRTQSDDSLKIANERLYQAWERERELLKEVGELKAEVAMLKERVAAREQPLRDIRNLYELQEADVGLEETSADIAPLKPSTGIGRTSSSD